MDITGSKTAIKIAIGIIILVFLLALAAYFMLPVISDFIDTHFEPGLGIKNAAVVSFFVTVALLVVFAIAAGDSLIGEIQFMIPAFFSFFVLFWLMIAWIF